MDARRGGGWRFACGVFGGLVFGLTVLVIKLTFGWVTLPDALMDRILRIVPLDLFSLGISLLGSWAKFLFYLGMLFGLVTVGGLVGLVLRPVVSWPAGLGVGLGAWLFLGLMVMPLLGAGPFGAGLPGGFLPAAAGLLVSCLSYGLGLVGAWRLLGVAGTSVAVNVGRRRFLAGLGVIAGLLLAGGGLLRQLSLFKSQSGDRFSPPTPEEEPIPTQGTTGEQFSTTPQEEPITSQIEEEPLFPQITPTDQFYSISKNVVDPKVDLARWRLEIGGLVERPFSLSYEELRRLPVKEEIVTLECIGNEVGGDLIGTARWRGISLAQLLAQAGLQPGVRKVIIRAWDNFSTAIPLETAVHPDTILVYDMNGEPLSHKHGFPLRLIVPGLYGMKNPKWVTAVEAVDYDYLGYWEQRGWSDQAVIKTMSQIILPSRTSAVLGPGVVRLAGIAFAGDRGIQRVEVSFDGGRSWHQARLRPPLSPYSWVLWTVEWSPSPGSYRVLVRAVDGAGQLQDPTPRKPAPDGASGYHAITVQVREI